MKMLAMILLLVTMAFGAASGLAAIAVCCPPASVLTDF